MGEVLGELLPLATGVAVSPIPIIGVILMLLAPQARAASVAFAVGWLTGITAITVVVVVVADGADAGAAGTPSTVASWVKIVLGALLLVLAFGQFRHRPAAGEAAALPKWMAAIDSIHTPQAAGLGFALAAINPKNALLCVTAGVTTGQAELPTSDVVVVVAIFVLLAGVTVVVPVLAYLVAQDRMHRPLDELKGWLQQHNAVVMGVLLLVLGMSTVGKGLGGVL